MAEGESLGALMACGGVAGTMPEPGTHRELSTWKGNDGGMAKS